MVVLRSNLHGKSVLNVVRDHGQFVHRVGNAAHVVFDFSGRRREHDCVRHAVLAASACERMKNLLKIELLHHVRVIERLAMKNVRKTSKNGLTWLVVEL